MESSSSNAPDRLTAALAGRYTIQRELGRGGMATVHLAHDERHDRLVALKVLDPELGAAIGAERFLSEIRVTAQLQHPHILPLHDSGTVPAAGDGAPALLWYVMPFVEGESLRDRLTREGRLSIHDAAEILRELASALAYAHAKGVVHRDIKPENVLLSNGHAVLADFGIARAAASRGERLTQIGFALGTPTYMSPEQAAGEIDVGPASDIYSLGILGYELLAGGPPFAQKTPRELITAHLTTAPRPITELRREVPAAVAGALTRALAKDPAERFTTADEFRSALDAGVAARPAGRRRVWQIAGGVAVAAAAVLAIVVPRLHRGATLDANVLAVAPFEVLDPQLAMWHEGMVDVLSSNLDGAGPLRTIPATVVVRRWGGHVDAASATELGRRTGAGIVVYGRIVGAGAGLARATVTIHDAAADRTLGEFEVRDSSTRIDRLADSVTIHVLRQLNQTQAITAVRQATFGSSSLPALKAYLQGEQQFRRSNWDSAAAYYRRAIDADSAFALAYRRLSNAMSWHLDENTNRVIEAYGYALKAGMLNHGLAPRDSLLVLADSLSAALQLRNSGGKVDPIAVARRLHATLQDGSRLFPNDPEVWHKLADARFHNFYFFPGVRLAQSREAFERSIALDSAFAPSYVHMPDLALRERDTAAARRYIHAYLALSPQDQQAKAYRILDRLLDPKQRASVRLDSILAADPMVLANALQPLVDWVDSSEVDVHVLRTLDSLSRTMRTLSPAIARQAHSQYVYALSRHGHLRAAVAAADSSSFLALPPLGVLGAATPAQVDSAAGLTRKLRPYQVGSFYRWWAERRDTASLQAMVAVGEQRADKAKGMGGIATLNTAAELAFARGYLALARRDTTNALREFTTIPDSICTLNACYDAWLETAQLLAARHDDRRALSLLARDPAMTDVEWPIWTLERARAAERTGQRAQALADYEFVIAALAHADPVLQPAVSEARAAQRRLQGAR